MRHVSRLPPQSGGAVRLLAQVFKAFYQETA